MIERVERPGAGSAVAPAVGAALTVVGLFFVVDGLTVQRVFSGVILPVLVALLGVCTLGLGLFRASAAVLWTSRFCLGLVAMYCALSVGGFLPAEYALPTGGVGSWESWFVRADAWFLLGAICLSFATTSLHAVSRSLGAATIVLSLIGGATYGVLHVFPATASAVVLPCLYSVVGALCGVAAVQMTGRNLVSGLAWLPVVSISVLALMSVGADPSYRSLALVCVFVGAVLASVLIGSAFQLRTARVLQEASQALAESNRVNTLTEEIGGGGSWSFDEHKATITLSAGASRLLGLEGTVSVGEMDAKFVNGEFAEWLARASRGNDHSQFAAKVVPGGWVEVAGQRVFTDAGEEVRGTVRDVTPIQESLEELSKRIALLEAVASKVPDIDFVYNISHHEYEYFNRPPGALLGRPDDGSGMVMESAVLEGDRSALFSHIQQVNRAQTSDVDEFEFRVLGADGTVLWIRSRASVFTRDEHGNPETIFGTYQDVTGQRELMEKLEETEARYERVSAKCPGVIYQFAISPSGRLSFPYVSDGIEDLFGVSKEEVVANAESAFALVHEDDVADLMQLIEESRRTLSDFAWVGRIVRPDKRTVWVQVASRPTMHEDGTIVWDGVSIDVTSTKVAQLALEETQRRYDALVAESATVAYACGASPPYPIVSVAPNVRFILGYIPDQLIDRPLFGTSFVHPDDFEEFRQHEHRFIDHGRSKCDYRVRSLSGDFVWIRDDVRIVPLQDGAVEVVGTWTEVSDLRNAILQAQESDERFLRMTAQAPGMLVELALLEDGRPEFRFVSHGSYELVGLPPEDVKSRAESFLRMVDDDTKPLLYRQLVRSQQDLGYVDWHGSVNLPDGRRKRIRFQARPHSGEDPVVVWTGAFFEVASVERDERPVEAPVAEETPVVEEPKEALQGFEIVVIAPVDEAERLLAEGMGRWEGMTITVATSGGLGLELAKRRRPAAIVAVEGLSDASANSLLEAIRADDDLRITPVIVFGERQGEGSRSRLLRAGADLVLDEAPTLKGLQEALSGVLARV